LGLVPSLELDVVLVVIEILLLIFVAFGIEVTSFFVKFDF